MGRILVMAAVVVGLLFLACEPTSSEGACQNRDGNRGSEEIPREAAPGGKEASGPEPPGWFAGDPHVHQRPKKVWLLITIRRAT
jgi:hypothetical protein